MEELRAMLNKIAKPCQDEVVHSCNNCYMNSQCSLQDDYYNKILKFLNDVGNSPWDDLYPMEHNTTYHIKKSRE